jgi:hypothetical protein
MARRATGTVSRLLVTGVGELVLHRHRRLDGAFCMRPLGKSCRWCRNIADLEAGQPVQLTGDDIYAALCADEHLARTCRDLMQDQSVYEVRADTLDLIAATLPSSGTDGPAVRDRPAQTHTLRAGVILAGLANDN